jgi:hypothetical protein
VEQLFSLPPLAAQKPSELLSEMLRLSPRRQENNAFFNYLFLNKLPREPRILLLLSEADVADKQAPERTCLSLTTASTLITCWQWWPPALSRSKERSPQWRRCAPEQAEANAAGGQQGGSGRGKKKPGHGGRGGSGQQVSHMVSHAEQARLTTGLCFNPLSYGAKLKTCCAPCTWSGN